MKKSSLSVAIFTLVIAVISLASWFKPQTEYSESERRPLAEKPTFSAESVFSGEFMNLFEEYAADQFPMREEFRSLKALFSKYVLGKKENNGLFIADGHISKLEYPVNPQMVDYAKERFDYIYEKYLKGKDAKVYLSLVPDKNYFLAEKNGYPSIDYEKFADDFKNKMDYMEYIDIFPLLSIDDFYKTDSHWKQERIVDVACFIASKMGVDINAEYEIKTLENEFGGVYLGQAAVPFEKDTIKYITNEAIENAKVSYFDTGKEESGEMYNMEKAHGKDPYEMFLSGTSALIEIENEKALSDKELVIFRDSYGSSLAPLLCDAYKKITIVDIRYIQSDFLGNFVEFEGKDVLFLYSTTLINNSKAMR